MEHDVFKFWEHDMRDQELPELPVDRTEEIIEANISDPIFCAKALQQYIQSTYPSQEAQESTTRKAVGELNYRFFGLNAGNFVRLSIDTPFDIAGTNEAADMIELTNSLRANGEVDAAGRFAPFERHYYLDPKSGVKRPIISIRLDTPRFIDGPSGNGQLVSIPNFLTVPVTAINDHKIVDLGEECL
ncbi:MAG TPA: hypothetical protein VMT96_00725 [Candidatus Bathyarchaeia archaeon]|nr:hypothetical protein [Candidatus Bathyarchaeia archaeon]